jgi:predicted nucleic acid-binding protein
VTTVVDSNVLVPFWDIDHSVHTPARQSLEEASAAGGLIVPAPVVAELLAAPGRTESFVDSFLRDTGIGVDWHIEGRIWRAAGRAFQSYAERRRDLGGSHPRRILADFVIGAYADLHGYRLLTLDKGAYRAAFPKLKLVVVP